MAPVIVATAHLAVGDIGARDVAGLRHRPVRDGDPRRDDHVPRRPPPHAFSRQLEPQLDALLPADLAALRGTRPHPSANVGDQ
jgi:hypothetical protein